MGNKLGNYNASKCRVDRRHLQEHWCSAEELLDMAVKFADWLEKTGYATYDPYDIWGTKFGIWARQIYYHKEAIGLPLITPLLALEMLWPGGRSLFVKKARYATADGQLVLAFLNLHATTREQRWLDKAESLAEELKGYSISGYRGHCWGYPFDWQNLDGFWKSNTPYITVTPYCFEAYLRLFELTQKKSYLDLVLSIINFVAYEIQDTEVSPNASAGSYSPFDRSKIVNTSAYRAFILFEVAYRFAKEAHKERAQRNLNFILQSQREDGAWLYAIGDSKQGFIDHFHTCFVLKNLYKLNRRLQSDTVRSAIHKGYEFYRRELFDSEGNPKYFALQARKQIIRLEMYNVAEAITLGTLLKDEIPEAFEMAHKLAMRVRQNYQLPDGHFVTRVYRGGVQHTFPFLRWPQAQMFYAVTNMLSVLLEAGFL